MVTPLPNERETIQRCQSGDVAAYEIIYRHFEQPLLNLGVRVLGNQADAEDAVQMAFMRLYRGIGKFKFQSKFSSYFYRIMMRVCLDMLEKRKRTAGQEVAAVEPQCKPVDDLRLQLEEALQTLPHRMRACFVLFAVQGFKQDEICEILNLRLGTVKSHVFFAKRKLRELLGESRERKSDASK